MNSCATLVRVTKARRKLAYYSIASRDDERNKIFCHCRLEAIRATVNSVGAVNAVSNETSQTTRRKQTNKRPKFPSEHVCKSLKFIQIGQISNGIRDGSNQVVAGNIKLL